MARLICFTTFFAAILLHAGLSAQINNYYNAPPQTAVPGVPASPGVTPFQGAGTTTNPYQGAGYPAQGAGYPYPGYNYYQQQQLPPGYQSPGPGTSSPPGVTPFLGATAAPATTYPYQQTTTALNQVYPQPAQPSAPQQPAPSTLTPLSVPVPAYGQINPPDTWSPGLATIKDGKWTVTDFLYNLTPNIGVKVMVVKPEYRYVPLSDQLLEKKVTGLFQDASITPTAFAQSCEPPLPVYVVTVMAYPCERRCVGVVTAQLYEIARPDRIDEDLSGVWQVVTWERQELVASSCDSFSQEIEGTITGMTEAFIAQYNHFNPIPERKCFEE